MNSFVVEDAQTIANASLDWSKLKNKTVFISGANGYVPQFFVHGLLMRNELYGDGIKVVAMCRNAERASKRFAEYEERNDFQLLIGDVKEPIVYEGKIDYIIHAASPANQRDRHKDLVGLFDANVTGSKNMLELAKKNDAVFLFVSSVDVYGKNVGNKRLTEDYSGPLDSLNPRNVYACAKRAAETLCLCYASKGVPCKIARASQILGSGIELDDGRLHIDFISQILQSNKIVLKGDGTPLRTFLYVTDAITGMLTVMLEGVSCEAYNVLTEDCEASVLELAKTMAELAGERNVSIEYNMETRTTDPAVTNVVSVVCGESKKLCSLGWKAQVSLKDACARMMKYYEV